MIEDLGAMGLHNRNLADFRLVKSDKAMALIWRESTQILNETTNLTRHHAERIRRSATLCDYRQRHHHLLRLLSAAHSQG